MPKRSVLLVSSENLFGESVEALLRRSTELQVFGPLKFEDDIPAEIARRQPKVVVIAGEDEFNAAAIHLTAHLVEHYPDLVVIRVGLAQKVFRVFSMHTLPARGSSLLEVIQNFSL